MFSSIECRSFAIVVFKYCKSNMTLNRFSNINYTQHIAKLFNWLILIINQDGISIDSKQPIINIARPVFIVHSLVAMVAGCPWWGLCTAWEDPEEAEREPQACQ